MVFFFLKIQVWDLRVCLGKGGMRARFEETDWSLRGAHLEEWIDMGLELSGGPASLQLSASDFSHFPWPAVLGFHFNLWGINNSGMLPILQSVFAVTTQACTSYSLAQIPDHAASSVSPGPSKSNNSHHRYPRCLSTPSHATVDSILRPRPESTPSTTFFGQRLLIHRQPRRIS